MKNSSKTTDILIIGNGILGISTAYALILEDPTLKISVVGPSLRQGAGSLAAGAMLNCFAEVSKFTFNSKAGISKFNIAREASQRWTSWLETINAGLPPSEKVIVTPGTFILLNSRSGNRESHNFSAIQEALKKYQESYEEVDPLEIPGICPADDSRPLRALYLPNEGSLNPANLLAALEKASLKKGRINFVDSLANNILIDTGRVIGVKTSLGQVLSAATVILTAGAYSQRLIEQIPSLVNRIPKILAGPGCSLILKSEEHQFKNVVRSPNRSGSCGIHMLPYKNNSDLLYMGSSNNIRLYPTSNPKGRDVYYLLERAMEQFNQNLHKAEILEWRLGNRPVPFDTFPLIGSTSITGLWLLTGTYRDGIHSSPLLASSMARAILQQTPLFNNVFQPERFPVEVMTKEESIAEFTDQYLSVGYEHSMKLPKLSWDLGMREMIYKRTEALYEALDIDIGLSPDILFMFDQQPEMIPIFREYYRTLKQEFSIPLNRKIVSCEAFA